MAWVVGAARAGHGGGGVSLGAATHLSFSVQPTNVVVNAVISPTVQVSALLANGSVDTNYTGSITVARGSGTSTLSGTVTQTAIAGIASFNDLSLNVVENADTLTASATGLTGATSSTFNVTSSGASPVLVEDWSTYTSNANMIADPRGIYVGSTDEPTGGGPDGNGWQFLLDTSVGVTSLGLTQSMRYDQVDLTSLGGSGTSGRCTDHTVDRGLKLNNPEVWIEAYVAFSSNFSVQAPSGWGCTSGQEYKFMFGGVNSTSRFNIEMQPSRWILGYPTNETSIAITSPAPSTVIDGTFHQFRWHMKLGSGTGLNVLAIDGTVCGNDQNINTGSNSEIVELYLGVNMNQGPGQTQHIWWGRIKAWYSDPGWGF